MLHVACNKGEIYFSGIGDVDSKWPNFNAPAPYTPWFWGFLCPFGGGVPVTLHDRKENAACRGASE